MLIYVEDHLAEVVSKEVNANARMHTHTTQGTPWLFGQDGGYKRMRLEGVIKEGELQK